MVAYCATTLQGDTCTDGHCPYRHDILRCEPCGRSFPASLLNQHQSGKKHQLRVLASDISLDPWQSVSQPTPSPPVSPSPQLVPPHIYSEPLIKESVPIQTEDPLAQVTVSHEYGLDFIVEGTGTAGLPSFPSISHTVFIENVNPSSSLSVVSLSLEPRLSSWCEWFGNSLRGSHSLHTALLLALLTRRRWSSRICPARFSCRFSHPVPASLMRS